MTRGPRTTARRCERVSGQKVKPFIQNVHHFRDEGIRFPPGAPDDHVVIFDEAQRAWTNEDRRLHEAAEEDRGSSSPSPSSWSLYGYRHRDWAVVVCLVGGGQEINTGEAGIERGSTRSRGEFPIGRLVSPDLTDSEYSAEGSVRWRRPGPRDSRRPHLAVSMRSFQSRDVSAFVKAPP